MYSKPVVSAIIVSLLSMVGSASADVLLMQCDAGQGPLQAGWTAVSAGFNGNVAGTGIDVTLATGQPGAIAPRNTGGSGPLADVETDFYFADNERYSPGSDFILTLGNLTAGTAYKLHSYHSRTDEGDTTIPNVTITGATSVTVPDSIVQNHAIMNMPAECLFTAGPGDVVIRYQGPDGGCPGCQAFFNGFELYTAHPTVQFESASSGDLEQVSPAVLIVNLSEPVGETVTVNYGVIGGTADGNGTDYTLADGTLTFVPYDTSETIGISIINDGADETDETITIELWNPTGDEVGLGTITQHTYTIIDPRPDVEFESSTGSGMENVTPAGIAVSLSHTWPDTVTVDYAVIGGTAVGGGADYTLLGDGTLTFDPYEVIKDIGIDIVDDPHEEFLETIELTLSNPGNAKLGENTDHTFTIVDDELGYSFTNLIGMEFVRIDPGTFTMGSYNGDPDEEPVHQVTISNAFYMSVTEVTNAQYEQFDPGHSAYRAVQTYNNGQTVHMSSGDDEAVIYVSWEDANDFCQWLSDLEGRPYRLATEAEWEYACRAGTTTAYYTGGSLPGAYYKNQENSSWPDNVDLTVKTTGQNSWGLWDMHGNVEEWCHDWYGPYESASQTDPVGRVTGSFRVSRGGSHNTPVFYLRSANRLSSLLNDKHWLIGFRVACGPMPDTVALPEPAPKLWATGVSQTTYDWPNEHETPTPYYMGPEVWVREPSWADEIPMYGHNHQPAVTFCDNGDILGAWYSCESERGRELTVLASRLRQGNSIWDYPAELFKAQDRNMHGTALFNDRNGRLYLFNGLGTDYSWEKLALCAVTSDDNGVTWLPGIINPYHGKHHQVIAGPIKTHQGYIIATGDANPGSAVHISQDNGQTFVDPGANRPVPDFEDGGTGAWIAGIHCGLVQLLNGDLIAFGRGNNINGQMPRSTSIDMGESWTYSASPFQPIGGGQRCVLLRLEYSHGKRLDEMVEGPILMLSFATGTTMLNGEHQLEECSGMFAAVSYDEAQTWTDKKLISNLQGGESMELDAGGNTGDFTMTRTQAEPKGYLSAVQSPDGVIHVCSSRLYYAFNLVWIDPDFTPIGKGDLDQDGCVEGDDLRIFADWWLNRCRPSEGYCDGADINRDHKVNYTDYATLAANWLKGCP